VRGGKKIAVGEGKEVFVWCGKRKGGTMWSKKSCCCIGLRRYKGRKEDAGNVGEKRGGRRGGGRREEGGGMR
jgi:hypothetical protein